MSDTRQAIIDTTPLALAVVPWGILTGALGIQLGLTPLQSLMMSMLVFAGAAQLSAMSLFAAGAPLGVIFGSVFVISSRHLLYSVVFRQHVLGLSFPKRLLIGFLLTDEMFALSEAHTLRTGKFSFAFAIASGLMFYIVWAITTLVGIFAGKQLHNLEALGLEFAIAATFIAMTFDQLRKFPIVVAVLVSGATAVLLKPLAPNAYVIIAALTGMCSAYWSDSSRHQLSGPTCEED